MSSLLVVLSSVVLASASTLTSAPTPAGSAATVTIRGHVSAVLSLKFVTHQTYGGDVVATSNRPGDSAFGYTLDVGDLGEAAIKNQPIVGGSVTMILRTNTPYVLWAEAKETGFRLEPEYLQLSDIGFGVPSSEIVTSGALATSSNTRLLAALDNDVFGVGASAATPFSASLATLVGGAPILRGETISHRGTLDSVANGLLVTTNYAVRPQLYRSQDQFSVAVTYTLASP